MGDILVENILTIFGHPNAMIVFKHLLHILEIQYQPN